MNKEEKIRFYILSVLFSTAGIILISSSDREIVIELSKIVVGFTLAISGFVLAIGAIFTKG